MPKFSDARRNARCIVLRKANLISSFQPKTIMKVVRKNAKGETRELLLKEYFLNAYLIAVLKKVGDEAARFRRSEPALTPVRVRSGS
jgi:hypothetical protein